MSYHPRKEGTISVQSKEKENAVTAMKLRTQAVAKLIENHQHEYDELIGDLREAHGLPRNPDAARKEARIEKLRQQLRELGYEGTV